MLKRHFKLNKKKTAVLCAVAFILAAAAVFVTDAVRNNAFTSGNIAPGSAIALNNVEAGDGPAYITVGVDPQMVFEGPFKYVGILEIDVTNHGDVPLPFEVFYSESGINFDQEHSRMFVMVPGENNITLKIDRPVEAVRIDPGTESGAEFTLKQIKYRPLTSVKTVRNVFIARVVLLTLFVFFILLHFIFGIKELYGWLFKKRYFIGIAAVLLCVCIDVNGSSLGNWKNYLYVEYDTTVLGESRFYRSDEWAVWTPMMISQKYGDEPYSKYNEIIRGADTDVNMLYALPVKNVSLLYRPFLAGFILLGPERGYAFYWSARLVCLFLASLELLLLITKRKKALSAAGAVMITFAPVIQWWFATNSLAEMIIFGCTFIVALYSFLYGYYRGPEVVSNAEGIAVAGSVSTRTRIICLILMVISAGGYILTLYPAWMVPFGYVFLALLLWVMFTRPKKYGLKIRDWLGIVIALAFLGVTLGYIFYTSLDTIKTVMGTVYPGNRRDYGGQGLLQFVYPASIFFEFNIETATRNTCELSSFITLFPLDMILGIYCLIKKKGRDLLLPLTVFALLLDVYSLIGLPEILGDITMLSFSMGRRAAVAAMFIHLLIMIRSAAVMTEEGYLFKRAESSPAPAGEDKRRELSPAIKAVICTAAILVFAALVVRECTFYMLEYMNAAYWIIAFAVLIIGGALYVLCGRSEKPFAVYFALVCLITGLLVNPVQYGLDGIFGTDLGYTVSNVVREDPDALWAVNVSFPINNYPIMFGARTINCTNTYPDLERWESVSEKSSDEKVYNRYAHIMVTLVNENDRTKMFELTSPDSFEVNLTYDEFKTLGVKYYLTRDEISPDDVPEDSVRIAGRTSTYYIYEFL